MIRGYRNKETAAFADGVRVRAFEGFREQGERRLAVLNNAASLEDLRALRSNHLEALSGDRAGEHSIRINAQWRICFVWTVRGPDLVEIVDYH